MSSGLLLFFLLTFAITETCFIAVTRLPAGSPLLTPLLYLGTFAPALVAIALSRLRGGAGGLRALFGTIGRGPVPAWCWAFALLYMPVMKFGGALVARLATGAWPRLDFSQLAVIPFAIAISSVVQAGEELGWRAFALPRMARRLGLGPASLVLGPIWAVWHLPLFYLRGAESYHQPFLPYVASVTAISVAIAWVYQRANGSLYVVMLLHAAINNTKDLVPSILPGEHEVFGFDASPVGWATLALMSAFALWALIDMARRGATIPAATSDSSLDSSLRSD